MAVDGFDRVDEALALEVYGPDKPRVGGVWTLDGDTDDCELAQVADKTDTSWCGENFEAQSFEVRLQYGMLTQR